MNHISFGRGYGHTTAMLEGAKRTKGVIIVAATQYNAEQLAKQCEDAIGIGLGSTHKLLGTQKPILVDHYAMELLLTEREIKIEKLERCINKMRTTLKMLEQELEGN